MDAKNPTPNYSADIDLRLDCGPHGNIPLSHASSTFVISAVPATVPACEARIIVTIDGRTISRPVRLVSGLTPHTREAMVSSLDAVCPF